MLRIGRRYTSQLIRILFTQGGTRSDRPPPPGPSRRQETVYDASASYL